jgi:methylmalonyl-CoA mutase
VEELRRQGAPDIAVFAGGIVPPPDVAGLVDAGVAAVLGPGTTIIECARSLLAGIPAPRE